MCVKHLHDSSEETVIYMRAETLLLFITIVSLVLRAGICT